MHNSSSLLHAADPNAIAKRLMQQAHIRDGLPEIAIGATCLPMAGLFYTQAVLPPGSIGFRAVAVASSLLIPVLCIGAPWTLKWVRRRYLIERTGYVQHKPLGWKRKVLGLMLAALMAVVLLVVVPRLPQPDRWVLAGTGLFGGTLAALCGASARFVVGGALMVVTGAFVAFVGLPLMLGFATIFGLQGLLSLVSGIVVFLHFIRQPLDAGR